jgi:cystathionine gamma-lyase
MSSSSPQKRKANGNGTDTSMSDAEKRRKVDSSSDSKREYALATKTIHAGQPADPQTGAVTVPISLATTFQQKTPGEMLAGYDYSRSGNPTRQAFEECVAALEGAKYALSFSSGSAATATIINMLNSGDHVVSIDDVYGGTQRYFRQVAVPSNGINFTFVDCTDEKKFDAAFTDKTKLVWIETPTNPTLKITDIEMAARIAHKHNCTLVVDNTFMSPALQNPLLHGADIVVHSITKYINGHSDVVGGVVATSDDNLHQRLQFLQNSIGAVPAPFDCYMALRGLKTLALRMERHSENAMKLATFLEAHPKITKVIYPGLESHPQYATAKKQNLNGFGGMVTVFVAGGLKESRTFLESLKLFKCAESLGAVESLAEHPAIMTHASVPAEQRALLGINDSLVRLSVGVEAYDDILYDVSQALDTVDIAV